MDRRTALRLLTGMAVPLAFSGRAERALAFAGIRLDGSVELERFHFTQLRYRGGNWDPCPGASSVLMNEVNLRTSVMAAPARREVTLLSPDLFAHPLLWIVGESDFDSFSDEEIRRLRSYLDYGGILVADDGAGHDGYDFDRGLRRELARVYPEKRLEKLPRDHSVFRAYYLSRSVGGRRLVSPYLEGIDLGGRTAVIYSRNGLAFAWERDGAGNWVHPCTPGGDRQRRQAFQTGVNIVMYALCQDYKSDKIHLPFLRQRV